MNLVQRHVLGLSLAGMLVATAPVDAQPDVLSVPAGLFLFLPKELGDRAKTDWLGQDVKSLITVWPNMLDRPKGSKDPLDLPPLRTVRPDQPDWMGRSTQFLTLKEAIALALENGDLDNQTLAEPVAADSHGIRRSTFECAGWPGLVGPVAADTLRDSHSRCCRTYTLCVDGHSFTRSSTLTDRGAFVEKVRLMTLNVELAYWNLLCGFWDVYNQEQGVSFAYDAWKVVKSKYDAGHGTLADIDLARMQYDSFRGNRVLALNDALDLEGQLRGLLRMKDANVRLMPSDRPTMVEIRPDWESAQDQAIASRPEIWMARQTLWIAGTASAVKTQLAHGFGMCDFVMEPARPAFQAQHFTSAYGFLACADEKIRNQEQKTINFLCQQYRRIPLRFELTCTQRMACEAFTVAASQAFEQFQTGSRTVDWLLDVHRHWCDSMNREQLAIRDYNISLATFEYAKGSILERHHVVVAEEVVPAAP
jgi:hypothetical protein